MEKHLKAWQDVHRYWFGNIDQDPLSRAEVWFAKSGKTDDEIKSLFLATFEAAARGELDAWCESPKSCLSLIILLDQFSRNLFRNEPRAFDQDYRAKEHCYGALERQFDLKLSAIENTFLYMPLMHSELISDQELCVSLFDALVKKTEARTVRDYLQVSYDYAVRHRDIVLRFGRFPHRNKILGRQSTNDEAEFLKQPNSSF